MAQFGNDVFEILLEELAAPWRLYEQLEGADVISWAKDIHWHSSQPDTLCLVPTFINDVVPSSARPIFQEEK